MIWLEHDDMVAGDASIRDRSAWLHLGAASPAGSALNPQGVLV
jgi:hypothetical protein